MSPRIAPHPQDHPHPSPQPAPPQSPLEGAAGSGTSSRFLSPVRLNQTQKRALVRALAEQGIGDLPSCQLFTGAAEYELGTYHRYARLEMPTAPSSPLPPPTAPHLGALKDATGTLLNSLAQATPPEPTPEENRSNPWTGPRLRRLCCELHRLVKACDLPAEPPPPRTQPVPPTEPVADPGSTRRFVRSLARTFGECFEQAPTLAPDSPFRRALELVTATAGIRLGALDSPALAGLERLN